MDDQPLASQHSTPAPAVGAAPASQPADAGTATSHQSRFSRWLIGAGAVGFAITLVLLGVASRRPSADAQAGNGGQTAPANAPHSGAQVTASPSVSRPTWTGRRQATWALDGTKTVSFALDATNDLPVWARSARPQLVARCVSHAIDVYVVTGPLSFERQTENHTVHLRVDDGPEESQQWSASESGQELFAPDGVALTDRLAHAHHLRFGFTPFHAQPVTADFAVDGFDELAPILVRTCEQRAPAAAKKRS